MKATDYIARFLVDRGIDVVFGYPGGMVTHLIDSFHRCGNTMTAYLNYNEQASAMAACGWAEMRHLPGVAYATSGPGATNLLTGVACAWFESIPCLFITGQVNTYEAKGNLTVRQRGFQETDIVSMAAPITKWAYQVTDVQQLPGALAKAFDTAMAGRPGPVLLDIPMNIQRGELESEMLPPVSPPYDMSAAQQAVQTIVDTLKCCKKPVILAGHGVRLANVTAQLRNFARDLGIPVITSMIAIDAVPSDDPLHFGFLGAYGGRCANYLTNYCDLIISFGSRLDCRQTGVNKELFAPNAKLLRVDIDPGEAANTACRDETVLLQPLQALLPLLEKASAGAPLQFTSWLDACSAVREKLAGIDDQPGNRYVAALGSLLADDAVITTDVGQNQVWVAQSLPVKENQRVLFSGGHGAMGYSLPAAIGACLAAGKKPTVCFTGDGGLQMNVQELQFLVREHLPVKIILLNNNSLGMIHHFQHMYFDSNFVQTSRQGGYANPDFGAIATAYGLRYIRDGEKGSAELKILLEDDQPLFLEVALPDDTYVFPKLGINKPIHMQEPELPATLTQEIDHLLTMRGDCV